MGKATFANVAVRKKRLRRKKRQRDEKAEKRKLTLASSGGPRGDEDEMAGDWEDEVVKAVSSDQPEKIAGKKSSSVSNEVTEEGDAGESDERVESKRKLRQAQVTEWKAMKGEVAQLKAVKKKLGKKNVLQRQQRKDLAKEIKRRVALMEAKHVGEWSDAFGEGKKMDISRLPPSSPFEKAAAEPMQKKRKRKKMKEGTSGAGGEMQLDDGEGADDIEM